MAAKQGLGAQFAQAGEDAKRAVLSRTGVTSSSWFSNLNTVCTIKSAPPRSPEVLQMLSTKSGWLYKRNEQHVWQARWCCVVPHTFLYYFDATHGPPPQGNGSTPSGAGGTCLPTQQQQEEWNAAVLTIGSKNQHRKQHEKRSNYFFYSSPPQPPPSSGGPANTTPTGQNGSGGGSHGYLEEIEGSDFPPTSASSKNFANQQHLQPTGIIDLECYSQVHRSRDNPLVLELAGDDSVNPDLRAFYFCAGNLADSESWTDALLNGRHAALVDECDAYKQVCDGFAQQLQVLHSELDQSTTQLEETKEELYSVRCHTEDSRRTCWRLVEECLVEEPRKNINISETLDGGGSLEERQLAGTDDVSNHDRAATPSNNTTILALQEGINPNEQRRKDFLRHLESLRTQDTGLVAAVQLLCNYTSSLHQVYDELYVHTQRLQADMQASGQSDQARVQELTKELDGLRNQYQNDQKQWQLQVDTLTTKYQQSQKELQDVQKDLSSTRMEMTMYQAQHRNKMAELTQHKKILKKEVVDLRSKLDQASAELSSIKLQEAASKMRAEQERQKSSLLERYVEKMESQVKVQQNMMEMMSQSGSVYGAVPGTVGGNASIVGSPRGANHHNAAYKNGGGDSSLHPTRNDTENIDVDDQDDDDDDDDAEDEEEVEESGRNRETGRRRLPNIPLDTSRRGNHNMHLHRRNNTGNSSGGHGMVAATTEDVDNKSHVSELTEDRTQRQFEALTREFVPSPYNQQHHDHTARYKPMASSPRQLGPPRYIIGVNNNANENHTRSLMGVRSSATSVHSTPPVRRSDIPRCSSAGHVANGGATDALSVASETRKLSVAQRARLEADRHGTPVRVRVDDVTVQAAVQRRGSFSGNIMSSSSATADSPDGTKSSKGQSSLWQRMEEAVLGQNGGETLTSDDDDEDMSAGSGRANRVDKNVTRESRERGGSSDEENRRGADDADEKKSMESTPQLSLKERSELQRQKQLEFLRKQGLIKDEADVKGGARGFSDSASTSSSTNGGQPRSVVMSLSPQSLARLGANMQNKK